MFANYMIVKEFFVCLMWLWLPGLRKRARKARFSVPLSWAIFNVDKDNGT